MSHSSVGNAHQEAAVNAGKREHAASASGNMPHSDFGNMRRSSQWPGLIRGAEAARRPRSGIRGRPPVARTPFCTDSPLEGSGFEPSVPPQSRKNFCGPSAKPSAEHKRELGSMIQLMPPQARSRGSVSREYRASRPTEFAMEGPRCYEPGRGEMAISSMHLTRWSASMLQPNEEPAKSARTLIWRH